MCMRMSPRPLEVGLSDVNDDALLDDWDESPPIEGGARVGDAEGDDVAASEDPLERLAVAMHQVCMLVVHGADDHLTEVAGRSGPAPGPNRRGWGDVAADVSPADRDD